MFVSTKLYPRSFPKPFTHYSKQPSRSLSRNGQWAMSQIKKLSDKEIPLAKLKIQAAKAESEHLKLSLVSLFLIQRENPEDQDLEKFVPLKKLQKYSITCNALSEEVNRLQSIDPENFPDEIALYNKLPNEAAVTLILLNKCIRIIKQSNYPTPRELRMIEDTIEKVEELQNDYYFEKGDKFDSHTTELVAEKLKTIYAFQSRENLLPGEL